MSSIWDNALQTLEGKIAPSYYDLWIRPIECAGVAEDLITLRAPNAYFKDWFSTHYLPVVLDEIQHQTQRRYQVSFEIAAPTAPAAEASLELPPVVEPPPPAAAPVATSRPAAPTSADLIDTFTFDSFVVGPANQLAHAAARAASKHPAEKFNP